MNVAQARLHRVGLWWAAGFSHMKLCFFMCTYG